ncbi:MAG: malectin domain-containing carbohydrate-binding protein, partial [Maribacter sp.]
SAQRIFDVAIEGATVLNDFDINAVAGPQTAVTRTFNVTVVDGVLNINLDATGGDGVDQPKLSAIEVVGNVVDCGPLPNPWTSSDIGAVAAAGETCFDNGRFEVSASGADIFGSVDEFHYVYQELSGDGEIIAQVMSLDQTNVWAKAGVMIRGDLDANAAMATMILAPNPNNLGGPGYSFQRRPSKGGSLGTGNFTLPVLAPGGFPHYVRLVRSGNTFTGFVSETNGNWIQVGSATITMGQSAFVGLATTSHSDGVIANAIYQNVDVINQQSQSSITARAANRFSVSPNPSSVETSLSFELPTMVETISIYDMSGSLLQTIKGGFIDNAGSPLNVQELPAGVYIVIVRDIDGNEYSQKLLVNNR